MYMMKAWKGEIFSYLITAIIIGKSSFESSKVVSMLISILWDDQYFTNGSRMTV